MFRNKLMAAFVLLGLATVIQAFATIWALKVADENVQRGRVANELYAGFVSLLSQKHQLRLELTNALVGIGNDPQQRQVFYAQMLRTLDELDKLSAQADFLHRDDRSMLPERTQRASDLELLRQGVVKVGQTMETEAYGRTASSPEEKRMLLTDIFDVAEEQDLRATLLQSISRERLATARDRTSADMSLVMMNNLMVGATILFVMFVLALARYFYRALTRPIERLTDGVRALKGGLLYYRIPEVGNDEFTAMAKSMNSMAQEISELRNNDLRVQQSLEHQVTERTNDFQEAVHRLEKVDLRRKQMFADISHELRTPTTAIRGEAEIALRYQSDNLDDYRATLEKIVDYSHSLGYIIDDMLTLARSDIDAFVLERRPMNINMVCARALEQTQTRALHRSIEILSDQNESCWVLGDEKRIEQVLRIILDNAVAYSPKHTVVKVHSQTIKNSEGFSEFNLTVSNSGRGISAEELPRVFDRHYRGAHAKESRPDGSGLGLPLAKTIVRAHQGRIEIQSNENEETVVTLSLPLLETTEGELN